MKSGEKTGRRRGPQDRKNDMFLRFPGFLFASKLELKKLKPWNASRCVFFCVYFLKPSLILLSLAKGIGNGQPSKTENFNKYFSSAKNHRKKLWPSHTPSPAKTSYRAQTFGIFMLEPSTLTAKLPGGVREGQVESQDFLPVSSKESVTGDNRESQDLQKTVSYLRHSKK